MSTPTSPPLPIDPYPNIQCSLLHSGDIRRYAEYGAVGGRLFEPFVPSKLKSASYEIPFLGDSYYWDAKNARRHDQRLAPGTTLHIPKNGIVFVEPEVIFSIPPYLALRFNLHIRLVHRGLLLGTGPLVDPGFKGRLLIPVHNLTDDEVSVSSDDGFIWVEVTKVSTLDPNDKLYSRFPNEKLDTPAWKYFQKANSGNPIRSSMPSIEDDIAGAKAAFEKLESKALVTLWVSIVGVALGFAGTAWAAISIWNDTRNFVAAAAKDQKANDLATKVDPLERRIDAMEKELAAERMKTTQNAKNTKKSSR